MSAFTSLTLESDFYQNTPFTLLAFFRETNEETNPIQFAYYAHYVELTINLFFTNCDLVANEHDRIAVIKMCKCMAQLELNETLEQGK